MTDHIHKWTEEDEWNEYDSYLNRNKHYTSYKCKDPYCPMRRVVLKETTTFDYLVDMSAGSDD